MVLAIVIAFFYLWLNLLQDHPLVLLPSGCSITEPSEKYENELRSGIIMHPDELEI